MRKIAVLMVVGFFLSSVVWAEKIAVVDLIKISSQYNKAKQYREYLKKRKSAIDKEIEQKYKEIEKLKENTSLLDDKKKKEIDERLKKLDDYGREQYYKLQEESQQKSKEVREDILSSIQNYARRHKIDIVISKGAVVYSKEMLDITDEVLKDLNK